MTRSEQILSIVERESEPSALRSAAEDLKKNYPGVWWAEDISDLFLEAAKVRESDCRGSFQARPTDNDH